MSNFVSTQDIYESAYLLTLNANIENVEVITENNKLVCKFIFSGDNLLKAQNDYFNAKAVVNLLKLTAATDILEFADGKILLLGIQLDQNCEILGKSLAEIAGSLENLTFRTVAILRRDRTIIPRGADIFMKNES